MTTAPGSAAGAYSVDWISGGACFGFFLAPAGTANRAAHSAATKIVLTMSLGIPRSVSLPVISPLQPNVTLRT